MLLWSAEKLIRPTFRNLNESYEGWAYRNGLMRQVSVLEQQQILEKGGDSPDDRLYRLTRQGWLHVMGGRNPVEAWNAKWDGKWRLVLFDVPMRNNRDRDHLRYYLRAKRFGYIQNSVWITPHPLEEQRQIFAQGDINVESLLLLEGRPCSGESDEQIVQGSWDFQEINRLYARHLKILDQHAELRLDRAQAEGPFLKWASLERKAWLRAVKKDPLLPKRLLPADYQGMEAWKRRTEILPQAHHHLLRLAEKPVARISPG